MKKLLWLIGTFLVATAIGGVEIASASTVRRVPQDYSTIQSAIDASVDGDTVLVAPGTYVERIDFKQKIIAVKSSAGADSTILDGDHGGVVVVMAAAAGAKPVLSGFTIENGSDGAIHTGGGPALIENNRITKNRLCGEGAIEAAFSAATIRGNVIDDNLQSGCSGGSGGGVSIRGAGTVKVLDNVIANNKHDSSGGGIALFAAGTPTIARNIISGNSGGSQGGGISIVNRSDALIVNNLIVGNDASRGGGIYWVVPSGATGPYVVNNTIAANSAADGLAVFADGFDAQGTLSNNILVGAGSGAALSCGNLNDPNPPQLAYNDVFNAGTGTAYAGVCSDQTGQNGNISSDPLFVDPGQRDFHLKPAAPAIDAGTSAGAPSTDLDRNGRPADGDGNGIATVDMGAYEFILRGTMTVTPNTVRSGSGGNTLTFTYTARSQMTNGAVSLAVPTGWSAPSLTGTDPGYATASQGVLSVSGRTILVSSLTMGTGQMLTIGFGSKAAGGAGASAPSSGGTQFWLAKQKPLAPAAMVALAVSPQVRVLAPDGSGIMNVSPQSVRFGSSANTLNFIYTAARGGTVNGAVSLIVPAGWSSPSTLGTSAGYVATSRGSIAVSGSTIVVSGLNLLGGNTFTISYGSKAAGGPGATAPAIAGSQTWAANERSSTGGLGTALASSPVVTVLSPDGAGTLTTPTTSVVHGSSGIKITFTYTAATGGIDNGAVQFVVPAGWSAPSTTAAAPGFVTASTGAVSVAGQKVTVSGVTRAGGQTITITYGAKGAGGPGATAPGTAVGPQKWQAKERSTPGGTLNNLSSSPSISVT
jgi:parallel beta-helix repeat protein